MCFSDKKFKDIFISNFSKYIVGILIGFISENNSSIFIQGVPGYMCPLLVNRKLHGIQKRLIEGPSLFFSVCKKNLSKNVYLQTQTKKKGGPHLNLFVPPVVSDLLIVDTLVIYDTLFGIKQSSTIVSIFLHLNPCLKGILVYPNRLVE